MSKYYLYNNASRRIKIDGQIFSFDVVDQFGGTWRGVLKLDDPVAITAIESEPAKRLGITEISEEDYENWLKKKLNSKLPSPDIVRLPTSPLKVGVGHVVIKEPSVRITPEGKPIIGDPQKPTAEEVVVLGKAPYVDPLEQRVTKDRRKKSVT